MDHADATPVGTADLVPRRAGSEPEFGEGGAGIHQQPIVRNGATARVTDHNMDDCPIRVRGCETTGVRFLLSEVAASVDGELIGPDREVVGAGIDSRTLAADALFVPVVAERNGHDFIPAALAAGAAGYLTAEAPIGGSAVLVADTAAALSRLGSAARQRIRGPVVGITGSVGKTSTKDLCRAAMASTFVTAASEKSFNNELGVPLTIVNAPDDTGAAVLEMGARGVGHIAELCAVGRPDIGVVLCIGAAHLELFGSLDGVAQGKGELVEALPSHGTAILNADDQRVVAMASRTTARVLTFGRQRGADLVAEDVVLDAELRPAFTLWSPWGRGAVRLGVRGLHNVTNSLAAAGAALAAGVPIAAATAALAEANLSPWRMELHRLSSGAVLLNDAYNANPMSMRAALDSLAAMAETRKVAVLGQMAELGDDSASEHRAIGGYAAELGIEVVSVGVPEYGGTLVATPDDALLALGTTGEDEAILLKASRVIGLERVVAVLVEADRSP